MFSLCCSHSDSRRSICASRALSPAMPLPFLAAGSAAFSAAQCAPQIALQLFCAVRSLSSASDAARSTSRFSPSADQPASLLSISSSRASAWARRFCCACRSRSRGSSLLDCFIYLGHFTSQVPSAALHCRGSCRHSACRRRAAFPGPNGDVPRSTAGRTGDRRRPFRPFANVSMRSFSLSISVRSEGCWRPAPAVPLEAGYRSRCCS